MPRIDREVIIELSQLDLAEGEAEETVLNGVNADYDTPGMPPPRGGGSAALQEAAQAFRGGPAVVRLLGSILAAVALAVTGGVSGRVHQLSGQKRKLSMQMQMLQMRSSRQR